MHTIIVTYSKNILEHNTYYYTYRCCIIMAIRVSYRICCLGGGGMFWNSDMKQTLIGGLGAYPSERFWIFIALISNLVV